MPRCCRFSSFLVVVLCMLLSIEDAAASVEGAVSGAESAPVRVWVRPATLEAHAHAQINFQLDGAVPVYDSVLLPFEVTFRARLESPRLRFHIFDASDNILFEGLVPLPADEGTSHVSFEWPLDNVADGHYRARLTVVHAFGQSVGWQDVMLEKRTYSRLLDSLDELRGTIGALAHSIGDAPREDLSAYARLRTAVAGDALNRAEVYLREGRWPCASALLDFGSASADSARAVITFASLLPEMSAADVAPAPVSLDIREGAFYAADNTPVFLFGLRDTSLDPESLAVLKRYGLNFASIEVSPSDLLLETAVNQPILDRLESYLGTAASLGIGVTVGLAAETAPPWLRTRAEQPDSAAEAWVEAVASPRQAMIVAQRQLEALAPVLQTSPAVNGVSLAFEPAFRWDSEEVRVGFQDAVSRKYAGDRRAVNRTWRTRLRTLDEIEILWDYDRASYQYDWQTWHQHIVSEHFAWLSDYTNRFLPGLPRQIALPGACLEPGETRGGLDRQALVQVTDVAACTVHYAANPSPYALPFPNTEISYRLLRSFAPDAPLVVSRAAFDLSIAPEGLCLSRYVHTAMWEAAVAGVSGCAVPAGDFWQRPECVEGFATASIDLNRLGSVVTALQRAEAPIAILWSMPSRIYRDGNAFINSVRRVYEGCAFFGYPVRFITEEECIAGGLEDVSVLVLPEVPAVSNDTFRAIDAYAKAGGAIVRGGRPAPYTPTGSSRHDVITQTGQTVFVRASDTPTVYLHALDAAYTFGVLPSLPRTINRFGYPLEGVKSRYAEVDGEQYLYVVNLRKEPVRAHLHGGPRRGRDLVQGRDVQFPRLLEPLDPMLIRLEPHFAVHPQDVSQPVLASHEEDAAERAAPPGAVVLKPVLP